jgi:hypothetical protein
MADAETVHKARKNGERAGKGRLFRRLSLIGDWGFRGSYGPDGWLAGLNPRVNVDEVEAEAGVLRPYPIAASRDEFNGAESFWRLLFRIPANVPEYDRAQLDQQDLPNDVGRQQALARTYYNILLLQKWHGGAIPTHDPAEDALKAKALKFAKKVEPPGEGFAHGH